MTAAEHMADIALDMMGRGARLIVSAMRTGAAAEGDSGR